MSPYQEIITIGLGVFHDFEERQKNLEQKAIKEYQDARNLPRKKKKKARKSALLLYSIANINNLTTNNLEIE